MNRAVTVTANPVGARNVHGPRQVSSAPVPAGAVVPAYASACADTAAYWSACQCFSGIVATTVTITAATPVVTVTGGISSSSVSSIPSTTVTTTARDTCIPSRLPNAEIILMDFDDDYADVELPFALEVFGASDTTIYASTNGLMSLFSGSTQGNNFPLPSNRIPAVSILPYHDDLTLRGDNFTFDDDNRYMKYQVFDEDVPGQRVVTFEWAAGRSLVPNEFYHFTATFKEALPGIVTFRYFTTTDKGGRATIGAQNLEGGPDSFVQYEYNQAGSVPDGSFVRLDTSGFGSFTTGTFEAC